MPHALGGLAVAFVKFQTQLEADLAIEELNEVVNLDVSRSWIKADCARSIKEIQGNMNRTYILNKLMYFSSFPEVATVPTQNEVCKYT